MATNRTRPNSAQILAAIYELTSLAVDDDRSADDDAMLTAVIERIFSRSERARSRLEARAALALVEDLTRIYERVLAEAEGAHYPYAPSTFEAVHDAVHDWAATTANIEHEVLTQPQLEELELDADEIRTKGSVRTAKGTAYHAAIVMVEHVLGVPERTTYDRIRKGKVSAAVVGEDPEADAEGSREARIARIAFAVKATTGLSDEDARVEAERLHALRMSQVVPEL